MANADATLGVRAYLSVKWAQRFRMLLFLFLAFALPAYANNPPQPDGLFSVLLIFPVVILGARLAGAASQPKSMWARISRGIAVVSSTTVFLMVGTLLGMVVALGVLVYAIVRGIQIIRQGRGVNRVAIGAVVMVFAVLSFVDYCVSIMSYYPSSAIAESNAVSGLRSLKIAESEFARSGHSDQTPSGIVGTLKDLKNTKLIDDTFSTGRIRKGYRYGEVVDPLKEQFLFCAAPVPELRSASDHVNLVPGASLLKAVLGTGHEEGTGYRSFAVDETGVIRWSMRTRTDPVTREEAQQWAPL